MFNKNDRMCIERLCTLAKPDNKLSVDVHINFLFAVSQCIVDPNSTETGSHGILVDVLAKSETAKKVL